MLSPITSAPPQISPEEHAALTSSTPAEFTSAHRNPPILRYHDEGASSSVSGTGFWQGAKEGTLWVTEEAVSFLPSGLSSTGWTLPYTSLTLHALTPASSDTPAHLYLQSDESDAPKASSSAAPTQNGGGANGHAADDEEEDEDEGDFTPMREIRVHVAPEKRESRTEVALKTVQALFAALSHCSALHASLMPNGEPSSFGFFPSNDDIDDDEEYDDDDGAWEDAPENGEGEGGEDAPGRMPDLAGLTVGPPEEESTDGSEDDPVEGFLAKVDWGSVPKPRGWDEKK